MLSCTPELHSIPRQLAHVYLGVHDIAAWESATASMYLKSSLTLHFHVQADKIATGHNADDIAETVLLNILRGDLPRLSRCAAIITGECSYMLHCLLFSALAALESLTVCFMDRQSSRVQTSMLHHC